MKEVLSQAIFEVINQKWPEAKIKKEDIRIDYPPENFGNYSCNVAMRLVNILKKSPREVAEEIKKGLELNSPIFPSIKGGSEGKELLIEKIEIAGAGFLNFYLSKKIYCAIIKKINQEKEKYGLNNIGQGKKIMVEFGQPNTHKAFHIGHLRSAISGLAVVKLYQALGYEVIRANYYGDVGMHVAKATWAMKKNGLPTGFENWSAQEKMDLIDKMYVEGSKAFKDNLEAEKEIRRINKNIYNNKENAETALYKKLRDWSLEQLKNIFKKLGVEYDRQYPESEVYEEAIKIVKKNIGKIFEKSEGAIIYPGEKEGLNNWVFLTKEDHPTYSAKDLALAEKKFSEYDLDFSIVTTSVEQKDYFKAVIHCLEVLHPELKGKYRHIPFGWLLRGNKKTSSRMGDTVKGMDIINEAEKIAEEKISVDSDYDEKTKKNITQKVAMAGLKFLILSHEFHNNINYDPDEFIKLNGFSGPFILYSYVRTQAILRKMKVDNLENFLVKLQTEEEGKLAHKLLIFPEIIQRAGEEISPHLVCNYLYELAQNFNLFYESCPIKDALSEEIKNSRLILTSAVGQVLKNGLEFLGIETVERM